MSKLVLVAAIAENGVIGNGGELPWGKPLPRDMANFKRLTTKLGSVIMGRKTAESLPDRLIGRRNIVLTRNLRWKRDGFHVVNNLTQLVDYLGDDSAAVIGGAEIYHLLAPYCQRAVITRVREDFIGDTLFPIHVLDSFTRIKTEEALDETPPLSFYTLNNNDYRSLNG